MTRSTTHAMFTIERLYRAVPERVFAAWSHKSAKAQWLAAASGKNCNAKMTFALEALSA